MQGIRNRTTSAVLISVLALWLAAGGGHAVAAERTALAATATRPLASVNGSAPASNWVSSETPATRPLRTCTSPSRTAPTLGRRTASRSRSTTTGSPGRASLCRSGPPAPWRPAYRSPAPQARSEPHTRSQTRWSSSATPHDEPARGRPELGTPPPALVNVCVRQASPNGRSRNRLRGVSTSPMA